jgi:PAS domain S-box-containing protein
MVDSTERGLAEEKFRLAVEACPNGMVMTDGAGKMVMVNNEIEQQFGYRRAELIGQPVEMLVPLRLRDEYARHREAFNREPEIRRIGAGPDLFGLRKDGSEFSVEVGLTPIRTGNGPLVLGVIVDVSERKRAERLKDEFVSTVSHELRTPLTSISGSLALLVGQWGSKLPDSAARLLMIAHKNSQRLVRLINDILDIEKMESGRVVFNLARVDVPALVAQAIEDNRGFAAGYDVRIRLDAASREAAVTADPDRLLQVITNLLSNAVKFSPPEGEVLVTVQKNGEAIRISVRDHGSGIPIDFKPHIFEKFAQADATTSREKGGTGLGLSIVKQIVERLDGEVGFDDAPDGGTIFHVELPVWDSAIGQDVDLEGEPGAARILVCEDERDTALVIRERLQPAGFAADFAYSQAAAIARADSTTYAAILVDLQLPDGDGISLILHLRAQARYHDTPIIVVSVDPSRGLEDVRSSRLNVLGWLRKPVDFECLVQTLKASIASLPANERPAMPRGDNNGAHLT